MNKQKTTTTESPESAETAVVSPEHEKLCEEIGEALKDVIDPELGINIVDLGLLYGVNADDKSITLDMTLTSAACPLTDVIEDQTAQSLEGIVPAYRINWVWMPPWGPEKITEDGREQMRALGFNI